MCEAERIGKPRRPPSFYVLILGGEIVVWEEIRQV